MCVDDPADESYGFQSSFELTGYITAEFPKISSLSLSVSKLFRAYGLYNVNLGPFAALGSPFQSSFELTGYITTRVSFPVLLSPSFKALSSLRVI